MSALTKNQAQTRVAHRILIDSGAGLSACPHSFARLGVTTEVEEIRARSATGDVVKSTSKATVGVRQGGKELKLGMHVMDVTRPILSAGRAVRQGYEIILREHNPIMRHVHTGTEFRLELTERNVFEMIGEVVNSNGLSAEICPLGTNC